MKIEYPKLTEVNPADFLPLLNDDEIRKNLAGHELFDEDTIRSWVQEKVTMDSLGGCIVRAIIIHGKLAGWCG